MRGFLATDEALAAARESLPRLKGLKGPYAAVTARDRTGKPHTILASSDEASIPGLAPPCFDSESYGIIESGYPGRQDLLRLAQDVRAVRSIGSVALELCAVACGEADLCVATRSCPWDHNAARIILQEAGGAIASLNGAPLPLNEPGTVLATGSPEALALVLNEYGMQ